MSPSDPRHGTVNGYTRYRCRCDDCKTAKTVYDRRRRALSPKPIPRPPEPRTELGDYWVFTELILKPDGTYGFDRRLVSAYSADEAIGKSGLDPAYRLGAVPIPSEAEYQFELAAEAAVDLELDHRSA